MLGAGHGVTGSLHAWVLARCVPVPITFLRSDWGLFLAFRRFSVLCDRKFICLGQRVIGWTLTSTGGTGWPTTEPCRRAYPMGTLTVTPPAVYKNHSGTKTVWTSRAVDLRSMFSEMCGGKEGSSSTKDRLSASRLARGLKRAGLPVERSLAQELVAAYSNDGRGRGLSYTDFHLMVQSQGLPDSCVARGRGGGVESQGFGGRSGTLDEQVSPPVGAR